MFNPFWKEYLEHTLFKQLDFLFMLAEKKVLPSFEGINSEAEDVESATYDELMSTTGDPDTDPGNLAESALDAGIAYYESMVNLEQSFLNLLPIWIYHLFEQHLLIFHKSRVLNPGEEKDISKINLREFIQRVKKEEIDITTFSSYDQIKVLRLLANTVKHAEGDSCQSLHEQRPDFFERKDPFFKEIQSPSRLPVELPLGGAGIFVSLDNIKEFINAIKDFWNEFWVKVEETNMASRQT